MGTITRIAEKGSYAVDVSVALPYSLAYYSRSLSGYCARDRIRRQGYGAYHDASLACPCAPSGR